MKLVKIFAALVIGITLLFLSGCKNNPPSSPFDNISVTENAPTFTNNPNSFSFTITADGFTHDYEYMINMNTQSLGITVAVTNYVRGSIVIELYSDTNAKIFSRNLTSNTSSAETFNFDSPVKRIDIHFVNSSASLSCAVSAK